MLLEAVNLEKELERFFKQLIKQSRKNLKSDGSNASGNLSRDMSYQVKENKNSFEADLLMPKYGEFINYGVKGVESGKSLKGYKYKNKKPPIRFLKTWLKDCCICNGEWGTSCRWCCNFSKRISKKDQSTLQKI